MQGGPFLKNNLQELGEAGTVAGQNIDLDLEADHIVAVQEELVDHIGAALAGILADRIVVGQNFDHKIGDTVAVGYCIDLEVGHKLAAVRIVADHGAAAVHIAEYFRLYAWISHPWYHTKNR